MSFFILEDSYSSYLHDICSSKHTEGRAVLGWFFMGLVRCPLGMIHMVTEKDDSSVLLTV